MSVQPGVRCFGGCERRSSFSSVQIQRTWNATYMNVKKKNTLKLKFCGTGNGTIVVSELHQLMFNYLLMEQWRESKLQLQTCGANSLLLYSSHSTPKPLHHTTHPLLIPARRVATLCKDVRIYAQHLQSELVVSDASYTDLNGSAELFEIFLHLTQTRQSEKTLLFDEPGELLVWMDDLLQTARVLR